MSSLRLDQHSHRRLNPLTGEWVLVSPHRTQRPWQGMVEKAAQEQAPPYDPSCYLCPGNERAGGVRNPPYTHTFVFENDYAALRPDTPPDSYQKIDLLVAQGERGVCRVLCFSPRHDLTLASMDVPAVQAVVDLWADQTIELARRPEIGYVQVFENRGAMMGASNPHPHCQIWATEHLPNEPAKEDKSQSEHLALHGVCLLCEYARVEQESKDRIVLANDEFLVVVPFWAVWPFETLLLPREHGPSLDRMTAAQRRGLADALKRITGVYNRVFDVPFPYSMGFHQAPAKQQDARHWHLHGHFYPPLLRSATVRKFMVGFEMLGTPQRDFTPESAAQRLRDLAES